MNKSDSLRKESWNYAFYAFGTCWIFEQRARSLKLRLRLLNFLGIISPLLIGSLVLAFGTDFSLLWIIILLASIAGIIQFILSGWALVAKWNDSFAYAIESISSNQHISDEFKSLAKNPPEIFKISEATFKLIDVERKAREAQDNKQGITEAEKRAGMRAALRQYRRECAGCNEIPKSLEPSNCPICGKFRINIWGIIKEAK